MILDKMIKISVGARNLKVVKQKFPNVMKGEKIFVLQHDALLLSTTSILECQCDNCGSYYTQEVYRLKTLPLRKELCGKCMSKYGQQNMINTTRSPELREKRKCDVINYYENKRKTDPIYEQQILDMKTFTYQVRKATKRTINKYYTLINPYHLPRGKFDYHIDHIITIKWGFYNNVPIDILSHYLNLRTVHWTFNSKRRFVLNESEIIERLNYIKSFMEQNNDI